MSLHQIPQLKTTQIGYDEASNRCWEITVAQLERDKGICQVCKTDVPLALYDCGHIIDVVEGGSDRKSNLLLMCRVCNLRKPLHKTRKEFWAWVKSGDWKSPLQKLIANHGDELSELLREIYEND